MQAAPRPARGGPAPREDTACCVPGWRRSGSSRSALTPGRGRAAAPRWWARADCLHVASVAAAVPAASVQPLSRTPAAAGARPSPRFSPAVCRASGRPEPVRARAEDRCGLRAETSMGSKLDRDRVRARDCPPSSGSRHSIEANTIPACTKGDRSPQVRPADQSRAGPWTASAITAPAPSRARPAATLRKPAARSRFITSIISPWGPSWIDAQEDARIAVAVGGIDQERRRGWAEARPVHRRAPA